MRRAALNMNDSGGYDVITLPCGRNTRVFTKEEFRLGADGLVKPRDRSRAKLPASKLKSVKKVGPERGAVATVSCGEGDGAEGRSERGHALVASQSRVTEFFGKDTASLAESCKAPLFGRDGTQATGSNARRGRGANKILSNSK
jgi:hypothetical protein